MIKNVKKTVILVLCLAIVYAVLRKTYRFVSHHQSAYFSSAATPTSDEKVQSTRQVEPVLEYNYQRTLKLISDAEDLKRAFYEKFAGFKTKVKPIDINAAKVLLADLYREKVRLTKHLHEVRLAYQGNVPIKKANTLMYHQKVIEQCAQDVAEILRKA